MNYKILLCCILLLGALCSCQSSQSGCRYEAPSAIFTDVQQIDPISFTQNGQTGIEKVHIPSLHLDFELIQSGCDQLKQECRFLLNGTYPQDASAAECAKDIANILYSISTFDTSLSDFSSWAEMLFQQSSAFSYDTPLLMPESGIRSSILKQHLPGKTILTLIIE